MSEAKFCSGSRLPGQLRKDDFRFGGGGGAGQQAEQLFYFAVTFDDVNLL